MYDRILGLGVEPSEVADEAGCRAARRECWNFAVFTEQPRDRNLQVALSCPAEMRLWPHSYLLSCWDEMPSADASDRCVIPDVARIERMRAATAMSSLLVRRTTCCFRSSRTVFPAPAIPTGDGGRARLGTSLALRRTNRDLDPSVLRAPVPGVVRGDRVAFAMSHRGYQFGLYALRDHELHHALGPFLREYLL